MGLDVPRDVGISSAVDGDVLRYVEASITAAGIKPNRLGSQAISMRMWKALLRAGEVAPRCRVQRLMRGHEIQGAKRRGRPWRTTRPDPEAHGRPDLVQRDFTATGPDELWSPPCPTCAAGRAWCSSPT